MEPKNEGLKDDSPFQPGDFQGSMLIFQGISSQNLKKHVRIPKFGRDFSQCDDLFGWLVNKNSTKNSLPLNGDTQKIHGCMVYFYHMNGWFI